MEQCLSSRDSNYTDDIKEMSENVNGQIAVDLQNRGVQLDTLSLIKQIKEPLVQSFEPTSKIKLLGLLTL